MSIEKIENSLSYTEGFLLNRSNKVLVCAMNEIQEKCNELVDTVNQLSKQLEESQNELKTIKKQSKLCGD